MAQYTYNATSETDRLRYYRNKAGESVTEIATKDKVEEATVKQSIRNVELYRSRHNTEVMNDALAAVVLDVAPEIKTSLRRQLRAKDGKKQDYAVQRAAIAEARGLAQIVQPKAPNIHATQVNLPGQQGQPRLATGSYVGMEDRLKLITQELENQKPEDRKQLMQAPIEPIIEDGEFEEVEPVESGS